MDHPFSKSLSHLALSILFGLLLLMSVMPAAQAIQLTLSNGHEEISSLEVGDDLLVTLPQLLPFGHLELRLLDESDFVISSIAPLDISNPGEPFLLWFRSGVVGCDEPDLIKSAEYRFRDFQEASALLPQRVLRVELLYDGSVIGEASLPTAPMTNPGKLFFSDAFGCPRTVFGDDENVYLSGFKTAFRDDIALFLVDPENQVSATDVIQEVRSAYSLVPQTFGHLTNGLWTHLMWPWSQTGLGDYGGIVGDAANRADFKLKPGDVGIGALDSIQADGKNVHGMTIKEEECGDCFGSDPEEPAHE